MSNRRFDHPTAFQCWEGEEHDAIERVILSGRFTMGLEVEAFEEEFAQWHGRKHGIMVNSGSSANLIAIAALYDKQDKPLNWMRPKWEKVDLQHIGSAKWPFPEDAIVPAIAWSTTYAPIVQHGMDLVPVDVDETWNAPVPQWIPRVKTRVLVVASILGNPGYLADWRAAADKIGAYLIEDNCESLGAAEDDTGEILTGTRGDMSTFSFFWSHQISAIEGGMILTDNLELACLCRILRAHGWTRDVEPPMSFDDEYNFTTFGYNVRPLEMHAAVAREQLKKLRRFIDARRKNFEAFIDACHSPNLPVQFPVPNGRLSPFGLPFCVSGQDTRVKLVGRLRAAGIDCRLPTGGSFLRHAYGARWRRYKGDSEVPITPEADRIHRCGLFLGNAPWDMSEQIEKVVGVMREVLI